MMDYKKLTEDLKQARELARLAAQGEDGGTANLDTFVLKLPRARESKVLEAIQAAGCYCRGKSHWSLIGTCYFVSSGYGGQGNAQTRAVEAMEKYMRSQGWESSIYYKMD